MLLFLCRFGVLNALVSQGPTVKGMKDLKTRIGRVFSSESSCRFKTYGGFAIFLGVCVVGTKTWLSYELLVDVIPKIAKWKDVPMWYKGTVIGGSAFFSAPPTALFSVAAAETFENPTEIFVDPQKKEEAIQGHSKSSIALALLIAGGFAYCFAHGYFENGDEAMKQFLTNFTDDTEVTSWLGGTFGALASSAAATTMLNQAGKISKFVKPATDAIYGWVSSCWNYCSGNSQPDREPTSRSHLLTDADSIF